MSGYLDMVMNGYHAHPMVVIFWYVINWYVTILVCHCSILVCHLVCRYLGFTVNRVVDGYRLYVVKQGYRWLYVAIVGYRGL